MTIFAISEASKIATLPDNNRIEVDLAITPSTPTAEEILQSEEPENELFDLNSDVDKSFEQSFTGKGAIELRPNKTQANDEQVICLKRGYSWKPRKRPNCQPSEMQKT